MQIMFGHLRENMISLLQEQKAAWVIPQKIWVTIICLYVTWNACLFVHYTNLNAYAHVCQSLHKCSLNSWEGHMKVIETTKIVWFSYY